MEFALNWTLPVLMDGDVIEKMDIQVFSGRNGVPSTTILKNKALAEVST